MAARNQTVDGFEGAILNALGLDGARILSVTLKCEAGQLPVLEIVRLLDDEKLGEITAAVASERWILDSEVQP
jgi:hypothetical protein